MTKGANDPFVVLLAIDAIQNDAASDFKRDCRASGMSSKEATEALKAARREIKEGSD